MCGIAGVINAGYKSGTDRFVRDALVAGMLRGMDSTGIMQVDGQGKIYYYKEAVEGMYFLDNKIAKKFIEDTCKSRMTITHTRAATQGKVNDDNAHPFVAHKPNQHPLVGVHNGSLHAGWRQKPGAANFEVDSQWALSHIAARGVEAFKDINGPFAFVWAEGDKKDKIFMARNSHRPMHILFTEDRATVLFASEAGMLSWLAERNNLKVEKDILVLTPDRLYEFDTSGAKVTYTSTLLPRVVVPPTVVTPKPHTITAGKAGGHTIIGTPPVVRTVTELTKSGPGPMLNDAGTKFIANIKLAAQGKLPAKSSTPPAIIDAKVLEAERGGAANKPKEEIVNQRDDDAPFPVGAQVDSELVPLSWFSERLTKADERKLAISVGFYRELHWFTGVTFDEEAGELLGEIEVWDKKNGKQSFTACIRGISQARSHAEYIDNHGPGGMKEGGWVAITGAFADTLFGTVFVASELNLNGKQCMKEQKSKAH